MREITDFPLSVEIYDFFKKCANLRPNLYPRNNLQADARPPSDSPQQKLSPKINLKQNVNARTLIKN